MCYSIPGFGMLWYCWDQNRRSILCTTGIEHTVLDHLPSNLNIVYKLTVLLIMLLHLFAKLFLGKTISSKSYNYTKERTSLHLAVQVCRVLT